MPLTIDQARSWLTDVIGADSAWQICQPVENGKATTKLAKSAKIAKAAKSARIPKAEEALA